MVYLFTMRIPPSTFFRFTHILIICVKDCVPVTSQFCFLHHFFQAAWMSSLVLSLPVFACSAYPPPITFLLYAPMTEFIMSEFRSKSLALARTLSRLYRSVNSADWLSTLQFALPLS